MLKALREQNRIISKAMARRSEPTKNNDFSELEMLVLDIDKSAKITKSRARRHYYWLVKIESSKAKEIYKDLELADFDASLRDSNIVMVGLDLE